MSNVSCPNINGNSSWQLDSVNTYISNEYWGPYSMGGLWTVDSIVLLDNALNKKTVYKGIDFNISFFVVEDIPDCFPPEFFSVSLSPTVVHRGDEISFSLEMRDTIAGLRLNTCEINVANSYNQQRYSVNNFFRF